MINSTIKRLFVINLLMQLMACTYIFEKPTIACFVQITQLNVVRVDESNHRFFAIPGSAKESELTNKLREASTCFSGTDWQHDWRLSLFSEQKYVGYADETHIIPLHADNSWAKAYLAEYDGYKAEIKKFPALNQ